MSFDPCEETNPDSQRQTLIIQARYENLDQIRDFVGQIAQSCGLNQKSVYHVQLAVDEACTNIIEHAYSGESDMSIYCTCQPSQDRLVITLCDNGEPFNPLAVPTPNFDASLEQRNQGGLGLYLMRKVMDDVQFTFKSNQPNAHNILTMVKRLHSSG